MHLDRTLDALQRQEPSDFQIVVVDQSDDVDVALETRAADDPRLTAIRDSGRGLSRARNIGWRMLDAEWIVYVDDDCIALGDWAHAMGETLAAQPDVSFVTGEIVGDAPDGGVGVSMFPVTEERLRQGRWTRPKDIGFGASMAVRRAVIEELGGWDERLGAGVPDFPASDDMDFNYRLLRAGGMALATPRLRMLHEQWRTPQEVGPLLRGYMAGNAGFAMKHLRTGDVLGGLWHWLGGVTFLLRNLVGGLRRRDRVRLRVAVFQIHGLILGTAKGLSRRW